MIVIIFGFYFVSSFCVGDILKKRTFKSTEGSLFLINFLAKCFVCIPIFTSASVYFIQAICSLPVYLYANHLFIYSQSDLSCNKTSNKYSEAPLNHGLWGPKATDAA